MNMKTYKSLIISFAIFAVAIKSINGQSERNLMLVGGALADDNEEIYSKFVEISGGRVSCHSFLMKSFVQFGF